MIRLLDYSNATESTIDLEVEESSLFRRKKKNYSFVLLTSSWSDTVKFWTDLYTGKSAGSLGVRTLISVCLAKQGIIDSGYREQQH